MNLFDAGARDGMVKVALELPDRVITAAITGAFLGTAVAPPERRTQYALAGAAIGGGLSHWRLKKELARGVVQLVR